ncbi:MAG: hypothetical protein O7G85_11425 [Planctomycetota bacterium]|nr:hypothetical protein [Planctomycetota bacterium]
MRTRRLLFSVLLIGVIFAIAMKSDPPDELIYTSDFNLQRSTIFLPNSDNTYYPLKAGHYTRLEGIQDGDFIRLETTVLNQIRPIIFRTKNRAKMVLARVVEEREWVNGELVEVDLKYLAACPNTGNVYNFGESVKIYENGRVVSREGSWMAGQKNAQPGLLMPEIFLHGARYTQAIAPGVTEDRSENLEMGLKTITKAGTFENCIKVLETSPLEPDEEAIIIYAPGVGIIADEELLLVEYSADRSLVQTVDDSR